MQEGIHPDYPPAQVNCACGNSFVTRSTRGDFQVDVCSNCHPFYTGTQKLIDAAGRVDRFRKRYGDAAAAKGEKKPAKAKAEKAEAAPAAPAAPAAEPAAEGTPEASS